MKHSMYCLGTDILDEGAARVLENVQARAGVRGLTVAAKYHAVRDIYPHNPRRRVATLSPARYFRTGAPDSGGLRLGPQRDALEEACTEGARQAMQISAWVVMLHEDDLSGEGLDWQVNCFGDQLLGNLCPASPKTKRDVLDLVREISGYPVDVLRAEALDYQVLHHGHHHERVLERYDALALWLLGVCFCEYCLEAAGAFGVDGARLGAQVREHLEASFEEERPERPLSLDQVSEVSDEFLSYLSFRQATVASLVATAVEEAGRRGTAVSFIDSSLIASPDGGALAVERGWQRGVDSGLIEQSGASLELPAYVGDPGRLAAELAGYARTVGTKGTRTIVRPGPPDTERQEDLDERVRTIAALKCAEVNFYCYGLYRLSTLDRIRKCLEVLRAESRGDAP